LGCEGLREGTQDRREQAQRDTKKWRAKPREAEQSMRGTVQWLNRRGTWQAKDMKIFADGFDQYLRGIKSED